MELETTVDLARFDPYSQAVQQDPIPWYRAMREQGPVFVHPTAYWAVKYDAVESALKAPEIFSSRSFAYQRTAPEDPKVAEQVTEIREDGWPEVPALLTQDDPVHARQRALVSKAFSFRRVKNTEPFIVDLVAELSAGLVKTGRGDFIELFGKPLPLRLIASMLSVPDDHLAELKRWTENRFKNLGNKVSGEDQVEIARSEVERQRYFKGLFDARRSGPQDDLLTAMAQARLGDDDRAEGEPLSEDELLTMVGMLMSAGNETTTSLLSQTMLQMGRRPEIWAFLKEDPAGHAPMVVEEALRMFSPTQMMPRVTTQDIELAGTPIPAGALVQVVFASANRDSDHFSDPDTFDPERSNVREHFGFGRGMHICLGSTLARIEARIALAGLAETIESFRVLDETVQYNPSFRQRGMKSLQIEITPV